jgi:preprotein translocase subunit SecG
MVLIQNEEGDSLGGIFAGGSSSAFGSRSGNFLTRTTTVLGSLFLIISLGLALLSRTPSGSGVEEEGLRLSTEAEAPNWLEAELNPINQNPDQNLNLNDLNFDLNNFDFDSSNYFIETEDTQ